MSIESVYLQLPVFAQNLACSVYGEWLNLRRYDRRYRALEAEVIARDEWSQPRVEALRWKRFRATVERAWAHSPFYRELWSAHGLTPADIRDETDLARLPIIDRETVQSAQQGIYPDDLGRMRTTQTRTSGTTGTVLRFPITNASEREQWAVWWRYRRRFGLDRQTWFAHFYGKRIVPLSQAAPPFWRINIPGRQVLFSSNHLREDFLASYVSELNRRRLPWLGGYPSILAALAAFMHDTGLRLDYVPKVITVASENLFDHQKRIIESVFGASCRQHYGMVEACANISECPHGQLHVDEDFGYVEFVPYDDDLFRVIATSFANDAFPLVRYDTGDLVTLPSHPQSCACGLPGRLVETIDGRANDFIIAADGRRFGCGGNVFKDLEHVSEIQLLQLKAGEVTVLMKPHRDFGPGDEAAIAKLIKRWLGDDFRIRIEATHELQRTASGKLRQVISQIPRGAKATSL